MIINTVRKLVFGFGLLALSSAALAEGKIVVLDLQAAVLSTDVAQSRLEQMEQNEEYGALVNRYESLASDLQSLQEDAEKNGMTWSEEQRKEKEEEAQKLRQDYEEAMATLQRVRQQVMQSVMQQMGASTRDVLEKLIESEDIGLVLNSQSAYHATADYDITNRVTELLNKQAAESESESE